MLWLIPPTLELRLDLRSNLRRGKETRRKYRSLVFNIRLSIITLWLWLWMWNSEIEDLRCLSENPGLCLPRMSCRAIFQMCWSWFDWRIGPFSQNNYLKFWIVDTMIDGRNDNWWNEKTRVRNILSNASMSWLFALVTSNEHHWDQSSHDIVINPQSERSPLFKSSMERWPFPGLFWTYAVSDPDFIHDREL